MDDEVRELLASISASQAGHLPVVAAFLRRIGLAKAVNSAVPSQMEVDIGDYVSLMVLDTLSGRSPLYHLAKFASAVDTGLLLGRDIPASAFNDTAVGRAMDAVFCAGTQEVFSAVALRAASAFPLDVDPTHVHFDTTSVSVWGDYPGCEDEDSPESLRVTYPEFPLYGRIQGTGAPKPFIHARFLNPVKYYPKMIAYSFEDNTAKYRD